MNNFNRTTVFVTSVFLLFSVFVVSGGIQPNPVEGAPPVYTLTLDAANAPAISSGVPGSGSIDYKNSVTIQYENVQDTEGYHTTIIDGGKIYNDASTIITSISEIVATFSGTGALVMGANYHRETTIPDVTMTSETPIGLGDYDYFEITAQGGEVLLTSLTITYSCVLQDPVLNYYFHGTYYEFGWVTRDPYTVQVPATYNELPVTGIAANGFNAAVSLTTVILDSGITTIGNSAFYNCPNLTDVTLPDTLTYIGQNAFQDCPQISVIDFPSTLTTIDIAGFSGTALTNVILPDGFTTLAGWAFQGCADLIDMVIPTSLTTIGDWAFSSCDSFSETFYRGDATQWAAMTFGDGNTAIEFSTVYFYSETDPLAPGYWYYDGGYPTVWPS